MPEPQQKGLFLSLEDKATLGSDLSAMRGFAGSDVERRRSFFGSGSVFRQRFPVFCGRIRRLFQPNDYDARLFYCRW